MTIRIGIIGASGYTGFELVKLLESRKDVSLVCLNSETSSGTSVKDLYPEYNSNLSFTNYSLEEINDLAPDIVFLAMGDGFAESARNILKCKIIDLSKDLRFSRDAIYGLPELHREQIKTAPIVANPGCYATGCILSALPIVKNELSERIIFDCKSGYSGAGRKPSYNNNPKNYSDNVLPYKITTHPHRTEIQKYLGFDILSFTPHVVPLFRGILCTTHIILKKTIQTDDVIRLYQEFYQNEPFVKIVNYLPEIHDTLRNNYCCIGGFEVDECNQLVIIATLDNLRKGASGQAIQNMNLMFGLEETEGLL